MTREEGDCQNCSCWYGNWDKEVQETMDEQAPGEECSLGQLTILTKPCPFVNMDE